MLHSLYSFKAYEGRTYDIFSVSYLDPYLLRLYDQYGNVIEVNSESNDPEDFKLGGIPHGVDFIEDWIAPYTGTFFVEASWNQGTANKFYRLSVNEDVNTVTSEPLSAKAARIFNWGESKFSSLFPDHPESEIISDYYARFYSNGNALAEKNGNVYFYNGETESIALVGTVSGFLPSAIADGF